MTATAVSITGRRRGGFHLGLAAGLLAPVLLLTAFSFVGGDPAPVGTPAAQTGGLTDTELAAQRDAFTAFDDALAPLTERGATTVVYGMRPGISDIHDQRFDDQTLTTMAAGWVDAMQAIRDDLAAVEVPRFLSETADLYRQAFDAYLATARALHDAARTTADQRQQHISTAADHGNRADQLYDTAQTRLHEHRRRLGLDGT